MCKSQNCKADLSGSICCILYHTGEYFPINVNIFKAYISKKVGKKIYIGVNSYNLSLIKGDKNIFILQKPTIIS